ncbi:MAG: hypothetical protein H7Y31_01985 [Chitinophagaceae bacterium]|nr:hypothetical protein [Chitinophagaceae bacterium]
MDSKFLILIAANVILFLLLRFTKKRKRLNGILTVFFTILITLTIIETGYRFIFRKAGPTETGNFSGSFNTPIELTGFTIKNIPDLHVTKKDAKGNLIYDAHYSIMADSGFNTLPVNRRAGYHLSDPSRDSVEFVFLGCSFTFATGVPDSATMAYRVGKTFNYNSVNFGGSGFGTHQAYQIFTHKYNQVPDRKKRVFVYTFIPDHLLRAKCIYTWCLNDPYFAVENDSLHLLGPAYKHSSAARSQTLVRLFSLNRTLSLVSDLGNNIAQHNGASNVTAEDYQRMDLMLGGINRTIQSRGDEFIVLHWDDYKGLKNPGGGYYIDSVKMNGLLSQLESGGAHTVNVSTFFDYTDSTNSIPQDNHPSIKGNDVMARKVAEMVMRAGIK